MYALHYALPNVKIESQYPVAKPEGDPYRLDGYIESLNLAIEIDEEHHLNNQVNDEVREKYIRDKLSCEFKRVKVVEGSIYDQVNEIVAFIKDQIVAEKIQDWNEPDPDLQNNRGQLANEMRNQLQVNNVPEFVENYRRLYVNNGLMVSDCDIPGHILEANGQLGFLVNFSNLQFSVTITKRMMPKLLITNFDQDLIEYLELNISEPKKNGEYFINYDFEGQNLPQDALDYLLLLKEKLKDRVLENS
jgi:very-short-patch-repair endonuclease